MQRMIKWIASVNLLVGHWPENEEGAPFKDTDPYIGGRPYDWGGGFLFAIDSLEFLSILYRLDRK